jgi:hypothetical protein
MREHPIPQDIVGYRFHIVGNMTIKQFAEIGTGAFIAFLLYKTNLFVPIKWTLMGVSFAVGSALAFVPFEERPLDHWFTTFIRVLYRPTKYFWKREAKVPEAFNFTPRDPGKKAPLEIDLSPARRERIKEYLQSVTIANEQDAYEVQRQQEINRILNTFNEVVAASHDATQGAITSNTIKPSLKVRVRSLRQSGDATETTTETEAVSEELPAEPTLAHNPLIPEVAAVEITPTIDQTTVETEQPPAAAEPEPNQQYLSQNQTAGESSTSSTAATYNSNLPFPSTPTEPNKLVGMVLTPQNDLISDAIIEIKATTGETMRAVKTNALGQFFVTTPLANGEYYIETERDQFSFYPLNIELTGQVMAPLEIRST